MVSVQSHTLAKVSRYRYVPVLCVARATMQESQQFFMLPDAVAAPAF